MISKILYLTAIESILSQTLFSLVALINETRTCEDHSSYFLGLFSYACLYKFHTVSPNTIKSIIRMGIFVNFLTVLFRFMSWSFYLFIFYSKLIATKLRKFTCYSSDTFSRHHYFPKFFIVILDFHLIKHFSSIFKL